MNTHDGYFFRKCSSKLGNIVSKSFFNVSTICVFIFSLLIKSSSNFEKKNNEKWSKKTPFAYFLPSWKKQNMVIKLILIASTR